MQCPQCGTFLSPAEFRTGPDGNPLCPFCGASIRGQAELLSDDAAWSGPQENRSEVPGLISIVCGSIALICLLLVCPTCGLTLVVTIPMAIIGIACGFWARGPYRVAGLIMNILAIVPALIVSAVFGIAYYNKQQEPDFLRDRTSRPTASASESSSVLKYQPLHSDKYPGNAFHFTWGDHRYIACSLQQFKGQKPSEFRSNSFPQPIPIREQVFTQDDVQILTYQSAELDKVAPLPRDEDEEISVDDTLSLRLRNRTLTGEVTGTIAGKPLQFEFTLSEDVNPVDCLGAPILGESVVGVVVARPGAERGRILTIEQLNLPARLR